MNQYVRFGLLFSTCLASVTAIAAPSRAGTQSSVPPTRIKASSIQRAATRSSAGTPALQPAPNTRASQNGGAAGVQTNPAKPGSPANTAQTPANQRLKQALALQFNKTPQSILATWSRISQGDPSNNQRPEPPGPDDKKQLRSQTPTLEVKEFEQNIVLSRWADAKKFLLSFEKQEDAQKVYDSLLSKLQTIPLATATPTTPISPVPVGALPSNVVVSSPAGVPPDDHVISNTDLIGLIELAPKVPSKANITTLGALLGKSLRQGFGMGTLLERFEQGLANVGGQSPEHRLNAARILLTAGRAKEASKFVKPIAEAIKENDVESIVINSELAQSLYSSEGKPGQLAAAWQANQAVLGTPEIDSAQRQQALKFAVQLAPKVSEEIGETWLKKSFTDNPSRGAQILAGIGQATADGQKLNRQNTGLRLEGLKLQKTAVNVLLMAAPERAVEWNRILNLLAINWLKEARFSQSYARSSGRPVFRRDRYGNIYYASQDELQGMVRTSGSRPRPIDVQDILDSRPEGGWIDSLGAGLRAEFEELFARLFLKNAEEDQAFPYIEKIALFDKQRAKSLVDEFLRVWTRNHNPNESRGNRNQYIYFFGFEQRANSIPLTRSKQQRNLQELQEWIARIRQMELEGLDEQALVRAFTACHSTAEVYRLEDIEEVFGSIQKLEANTVAGLVQKMRTNLSTAWRQPRVQEAKKTNRKEPEIQREVLRGYETASQVTREALFQHPESWRLLLAKACINYDRNAYQQEVKKSSEYTQKQRQVFDQFAAAAEAYQKQVTELDEEEFTTEVFDLWFYASLGACDLALLTHESLSVDSQFAMIRSAIDALPGEAPRTHLSQFANKLFTRMSPLKPEMKYRYLKGGFEIVGDHPDAADAQKVFQYYKDLVTEIRLQTKIDGSDVVGTQPFGLFVNLHHTEEVERESGGFAKYLQNQNSMTYAYNYGRPTNDYRDAFETAAIAALSEHFEVISVTFEDEKNLESREANEPGWRVTPYAYLLLKARGEEVDLIPPVKLDLDFLDTSGYAVLPIESKAIPVDTREAQVESRPIHDLKIVQTLDERRSGEGKLVLEVKATARGLIPEFDQILELTDNAFEVIETQDQGVSVSAFDPESNAIQVIAEREWLVELKAAEDAGLPTEFEFCSAKSSDSQLVFKRYIDADLVEVENSVPLQNQYGAADTSWIFWVAGGASSIALFLVLAFIWLKQPKPEAVARYPRPDEITPLSVISLLKQIRQDKKLGEHRRNELDDAISQIEQHFFCETRDDVPDLEKETDRWLAIAN